MADQYKLDVFSQPLRTPSPSEFTLTADPPLSEDAIAVLVAILKEDGNSRLDRHVTELATLIDLSEEIAREVIEELHRSRISIKRVTRNPSAEFVGPVVDSIDREGRGVLLHRDTIRHLHGLSGLGADIAGSLGRSTDAGPHGAAPAARL